MKWIPLGLLILLCVSLAGEARAQKRATLLGVSASGTLGNAGGLMAMHSLCQEAFGSKARMCTTRDLLLGLDQKGNYSNAWIQLVPAGLDGAGNVLDVTGYSVPSGPLNCNSWQSVSGSAVFMAGTNFSLNDSICNAFLPVACCK